MRSKELIKKFKAKAKQIEADRRDVRFVKTIAFLKAKGLLTTTLPIAPAPGVRLNVQDVLWAGQRVEPRIIEVLPAALLRFPKNFVGLDRMPAELKEVIKGIQQNVENGTDFAGIKFQQMRYWANMPLKDKRTKPVGERKQIRTFRLHADVLRKLEQLVASGKYKDQTSALEAAVKKL
jgi:hypothetical protein